MYAPKSYNTLCLYQKDVELISEQDFNLDDMITISITGKIKRLDNSEEDYYEESNKGKEKQQKRQKVQIELKDITKVSIVDTKRKESDDELEDTLNETLPEDEEDEY